MSDIGFTPLPSRKLSAADKKRFAESLLETNAEVFDCPCDGGKYIGDVILVEAKPGVKFGLIACWKCKNVGWLPVYDEMDL